MPFGTLEPYGDRARRREGFEPHVLAFSLRRKCCGQFGGSDLPPAGHSLPPHPPSYSPFGLITLSLCVHTLSHENKSTVRKDGALLCLVAEVGFEPHDLRVMSPTSYRTALLRDIIGAGSRGRTGTRGEPHGILSPGRLPIPPFRHVFRYLPKYDITKQSVCQ